MREQKMSKKFSGSYLEIWTIFYLCAEEKTGAENQSVGGWRGLLWCVGSNFVVFFLPSSPFSTWVVRIQRALCIGIAYSASKWSPINRKLKQNGGSCGSLCYDQSLWQGFVRYMVVQMVANGIRLPSSQTQGIPTQTPNRRRKKKAAFLLLWIFVFWVSLFGGLFLWIFHLQLWCISDTLISNYVVACNWCVFLSPLFSYNST